MIPQGIQILLLKNIFLITYLEPDILECEVKWALESITMNKEEVMEFQLSSFKS